MAALPKKELDQIKKVVSTPHVPLTNRTYKVMNTMDEKMDKRYGNIGVAVRGGDELNKILRDQARLKAQRIKDLQVRKIELEMETDIRKMEKGLGLGQGTLQGINAQELSNITAMISQLPEDQRPIAVQALGAFRQGGGDMMGSLGPLLMVSMLQKQPQTSMTELVTALRGLNEITKGQEPKGVESMGMALQVAKMLGDSKDTAYQTQIQMMRKELEELKPHDPVAYQRQLVDLMTGMGFKPGSGEVNVELENIKLTHAKMLQDSQHQHELTLKQMERDDARTIALLETFKPAVDKLSGAAATRVSTPAGQPQRLPLVCPNCNFSPIWVSPSQPVSACPQCQTQVTSQQYASRTQPAGQQPPQGPPPTGAPPPPGPPRPPGT